MHKIKLVPDKPFYNRCDVTVYDVTGEKEKTRCKIAVEYAEVDVRQLKEKGIAGREAAEQYYRDWIYKVVRHYIADDWECTEGMDEIMNIVDEHIKQYFQESETK